METFVRIRLQQIQAMGLALLFCCLLSPSLGACASIKVERMSNSGSEIAISGEIVRGDVGAFKRIVSQLPGLGQPDYSALVNLNSDGGDVQAAMEVGRIIRAHGMVTYVQRMNRGHCVSACVFILAGGVERSSPMAPAEDSGLGIHRPFETELGAKTAGDLDRRFKIMETEVRTYLHEMNISDRLADAILTIPPYEVKFLSMQEATDYRLIGTDPAYLEMSVAKMAKYWGISKVQYYSRMKRAQTRCSLPLPSDPDIKASIDAYLHCSEEVMKYGR